LSASILSSGWMSKQLSGEAWPDAKEEDLPNLTLFDFDGTITTADTFTPFIRYAVDSRRMRLGTVLLSPLIVAYRIGLIHASPVRASIVRFGFSGRKESEVRELGSDYARRFFPSVVRPKALERIRWHMGRGDKVVIVSASLDVYLSEWSKDLGVDLICTELETREGIYTGRYHPRDCTGNEKARRISETYDLKLYSVIYAYGDTKDDEAMLSLANKKYFRWQEVSDANVSASFATGRIDPDSDTRLKEIERENASLDALVAQQL
jgi:phosphatidylglycerophosphatase C